MTRTGHSLPLDAITAQTARDERAALSAPLVDVAGGDVLELRFSEPLQSVAASIVTSYPYGLSTPPVTDINGNVTMPSMAVPNIAEMTPQAATATPDPAVWHVTVPDLDALAMSGMSAGGCSAGWARGGWLVRTTACRERQRADAARCAALWAQDAHK